jgi:hypothetical protein
MRSVSMSLGPSAQGTLKGFLADGVNRTALEGTGRIRVDETLLSLEPMSAVLVKPDAVRQVFNHTDTDALWRIAGTPPEAFPLSAHEHIARAIASARMVPTRCRKRPTFDRSPRHGLERGCVGHPDRAWPKKAASACCWPRYCPPAPVHSVPRDRRSRLSWEDPTRTRYGQPEEQRGVRGEDWSRVCAH